jgi:phage terminase large subunit-like protein
MDIAKQYIKEVLSKRNKSKFCKWVKLCCQRHIDDLKKSKSPDYPYVFDEARAQLFIDVCPHFKHWQGEWSGKPFVLEPWQRAIFSMIFGWVRKDNRRRRFTVAYIEVPRKNGKSFMCGGLSLFMTMFDGESGGQIYTAATKTDQAKIVFKDASFMASSNAKLKGKLIVHRNAIHHPHSNSVLKPLSADPKTQDGLSIHAAICDELHQWRGRDLWDVIGTATGSRRQALIIAITTAGFDKENTICGKQHMRAEQVLQGIIQDETFFGIIYTIDDDDEWKDPSVWAKANPNLGVSKYMAKMVEAVQEVINDPSSLNAFLRLNLNVWTQAKTLWMLPEKWAACGDEPIDVESLRGKPCYGGLDLSDTFDISSFNLCFPPTEEGQKIRTIAKCYIPEEKLHDKRNPNRGLYAEWYRAGYLTATPGIAIDHNFIINDIKNAMEDYDVREIAFDRWGARKITNEIEDYCGDVMVAMGQGYASMNAPTRELMTKVLREELDHGGNPVLKWMAANAVATQDPAGSIKLCKANSTGKIDGIIALIMAIDRLEADIEDHANPMPFYGATAL